MNDRFPSPVYSRTVLERNFEDARLYFLDSLLDLHYAHALMLFRQGILSEADTGRVLRGLDELDREALHTATYDGSVEDLFFYTEEQLAAAAGADAAGRLHIARSRNDIDITLYRMEIRRRLLRTVSDVLELARVLTSIAEEHVFSVMPAHTHTQPAQPTTLGHYLAGAIEVLVRDAVRLQSAFGTVNRNPLGSCAITTTSFPIDRDYTAELLGFEGLQVNSYGAIAAVDYVLESAAAVSIAMVNTGKLLHDLLLWCMEEFGFLRLSDAFVQTSSIMPQKRNPVALEHARVLASRAHGEAQAVFTTAHNTPFGDIVDSEDDLFPLVFMMFDDSSRALQLLAGAVGRARFDTERMAARASARFLTVTELADTLVRNEGLSFREAHHVVGAVVRSGDDSHQRIVDGVMQILGTTLRSSRQDLLDALDAGRFVQIRRVTGGPAAETVREQLQDLRKEQDDLRAWYEEKDRLVTEYRIRLREAAAAAAV